MNNIGKHISTQKNISTQESIGASWKELPHSNDFLLLNMQQNIHNILSWKMKETDPKAIDPSLDEYSTMINTIKSLANTPLSEKDREFLHGMELYYYIVGQKMDLSPQEYTQALRNVRDTIGLFYLRCALSNDYDISKNPLNISIADILSICVFIGKKYKDQDGKIDWVEYFHDYIDKKKTKLVYLIEEAKKSVPNFNKEHIHIPLFLKLFDLNDESSKNVMDHFFTEKLGYTKKEIDDLYSKYDIPY